MAAVPGGSILDNMTVVERVRPGALLRAWRERRGMSQLDLAHRAGISSRHISFVETGRSQPSRDIVVRLSEHLDIPLRERNSILLAAGLAPAYPEHRLDDVPLSAVADAINRILELHRPFPALVVDRPDERGRPVVGRAPNCGAHPLAHRGARASGEHPVGARVGRRGGRGPVGAIVHVAGVGRVERRPDAPVDALPAA